MAVRWLLLGGCCGLLRRRHDLHCWSVGVVVGVVVVGGDVVVVVVVEVGVVVVVVLVLGRLLVPAFLESAE